MNQFVFNHRSMRRRDMLKICAGTLLSAGCWPGRLRAADNGKGESSWCFLAVNDLHFESPPCGPWFEKVIAAMKASAPEAEFCLLGGDQANDGKAEQLGPLKEIVKGLGIPTYATPGNHDIADDGSRQAYDDVFAGHLNQAFEHRGWQVIGVDSTDGTKYRETTIQESTFAWLDERLPKLDRDKPMILWTHFPLGAGVTYRPTNADRLLERFREFNLQGAFSGHWHGLSEKPWKDAVLTTDRCCARVRDNHDGSKEKGWFVCRAVDGRIMREFVQIPEELRSVAPKVPKQNVGGM
jgi:3',5'-cyclic AMP phosphodiesterase CpdA